MRVKLFKFAEFRCEPEMEWTFSTKAIQQLIRLCQCFRRNWLLSKEILPGQCYIAFVHNTPRRRFLFSPRLTSDASARNRVGNRNSVLGNGKPFMADRHANGGGVALRKRGNFINRFGRFRFEKVVPDAVAQFVG